MGAEARRGGGLRLAAPWQHYVLHLRPRSWPIVAGHMAAGFFVGRGPGLGATAGGDWGRMAAGAVLWVVLLNGGTLALNAAHDRDEGDIGYLRRPPPPPRDLALAAELLMLIGLGLAPWLGWGFAAAYAACFAMSLLYSVPPIRLKARAGFDLLINALGYGSLTFVAGHLLSGAGRGESALRLGAAYFLLYVAFYPLTQLYQMEEDRERGDRTLVIALGRRRALRLAAGGLVAAFALFAWEAGVFRPPASPRAAFLGAAFLAWLAVLVPWLARGERYAEQKGMYRALKAWGLTDFAVAVCAVAFA